MPLAIVIATSDRRPTATQLDAALEKFRGTFEQTPPAYSAKNIDGERSYDLARKAEDGGGAAAESRHGDRQAGRDRCRSTARPRGCEMQVTAGFYVRSLAHDLGDALGCGAQLSALRRTRSGEFGLDHAVPLVDVLQAGREALAGRMLPLSALLADVAGGDAAGARQPGTAQERRGNGSQRPRGAVSVPCPTRAGCSARTAPWWAWQDRANTCRLLGPDGDLVGLARPGKAPGFLHGWVVLG